MTLFYLKKQGNAFLTRHEDKFQMKRKTHVEEILEINNEYEKREKDLREG